MITSAHYSVDGTAVRIATTNEGYRDIYVHVTSNAAIYIGTSTVTTSNGLYVDKNSGVPVFRIGAQDELWCVAGGTTETVTVLTVGP